MEIKLSDNDKLVAAEWATVMLAKGMHPVDLVKAMRERYHCGLTDAKEVYSFAAFSKSLNQIQEDLAESLEQALMEEIDSK